MLGVVEGLHKARHFILGCEKLVVAVYHKPLLGLLNDRSLTDIDNPRLLMSKEKKLWFNFQFVWLPGRNNSGPDYMPRVNYGTKEVRINCILGLSTESTGDFKDDTQIKEVDIIYSVVASINAIEAITFDMGKVKCRRMRRC